MTDANVPRLKGINAFCQWIRVWNYISNIDSNTLRFASYRRRITGESTNRKAINVDLELAMQQCKLITKTRRQTATKLCIVTFYFLFFCWLLSVVSCVLTLNLKSSSNVVMHKTGGLYFNALVDVNHKRLIVTWFLRSHVKYKSISA